MRKNLDTERKVNILQAIGTYYAGSRYLCGYRNTGCEITGVLYDRETEILHLRRVSLIIVRKQITKNDS